MYRVQIPQMGQFERGSIGIGGPETPKMVSLMGILLGWEVPGGSKMGYLGSPRRSRYRGPLDVLHHGYGVQDGPQNGPGSGVASGGRGLVPYNKTFARARDRGIYGI